MKQTKSLLENGYVTSRGKAYASGTAFYGGSVHPWLGGMGNISSDWQNIDASLWNTATNGEYLADAMKDAADSVNEFEETIDWIEIRMEELDEKLSLASANLEIAGNSKYKNEIIGQMIDINAAIVKNAEDGAKYYQDHANKYLEGMSDELIAAAKDGSIDITEFTKEQDEATVKAIQNYREFTQKAASLTQQAVEAIAEIRDLYIQKIDNAKESGSLKATVENSQTEKLQNAVDLDEERGLIANADHYAAMMENSYIKRGYLETSRDEMQAHFNEMMASGAFLNKDGTYNNDFYEQLDKLYQIDAEIDEATIELEQFQNAINDIYWASFDELINNFDYISAEAQGLIDLMDSADMFNKPDNDKGWYAEDVTWTKEGLATLGLHAQEMERAEEKAKAYAEAIDDLTAEYKAGHYSESEYNAKLNELTEGQLDAIEAAQAEKEAIVELNEERIDAVKEGIEKQIEAYEELIEKKKEELSVEKDMYDFQKSVMEQSKNIAEIERKLAALSGDNSASAIAQRRQLEADLAIAKQEQEELYYERTLENKQDALDKELENFTEEKEKEIEQWDKYLEDVERIVAESLGIVQENANQIGSTLTNKANEYNLTVSSAVLSPWKDGAGAIDEYTKKFGDSVSSATTQLDPLKSKWQEVRYEIGLANAEADKYYNKKAAIAESPSVAQINQENKDYYSGGKTSSTQTSASTKNNSSANKAASAQPSISVGSNVKVKTNATHFSANSGNVKMASFVPGDSYTVYEIADNQALIGKGGAYTGWVALKDLQAYATGTKGVKEDQLAWIDENGLEELVMHAGPDGRLQYLSKGTSVLNSEFTDRIMNLAMNPQEVLDRNRPQIAPINSIVNNEINVDASVGTLIHVDRLDGNNPDEVIKLIDKAWDKKMQGLNSAIKKFSR